MATLTAAKAGAGVQEREQHDGSQTVTSEYSLTAALVAADVIQMVKIPDGATITDVTLSTSDLDTGGAPAIGLTVGDGVDPDRFITASTIGQAGGLARMNAHTGHGFKYATSDTIDVTVSTGPATGATTGTVRLSVTYTLQD